MAYYRFESEWVVSVEPESVYDALLEFEDYHHWWDSIRRVRRLERGSEGGVGSRFSYSMRSPLGYSLRFDTTVRLAERPDRIEVGSIGDLAGSGTFIIAERGSNTSVRHLWNVSTTKKLMNFVAPLARPFFVWAHHSVMREGGAGLAEYLGARLVACHSHTVEEQVGESETRAVS